MTVGIVPPRSSRPMARPSAAKVHPPTWFTPAGRAHPGERVPRLASVAVLGRPELEAQLSRARRWLSHGWEPILNGSLLLVFLGELGLAAWASYFVWGARWLSMTLLGFIATIRLLSTRFSRSS